MRRALRAAALFALTVGCGGQRMLAPGSTTVLAHAQGILCSTNSIEATLATCAAAGISQNAATVAFRVPHQDGTLQISDMTRYIAFDEYDTTRLICNGVRMSITGVSGKFVDAPAWFAPFLPEADARTAQRHVSVATVSANSSCEMRLSFDLVYSPPYTPFDLTVAFEAQEE